MLDELGDILDKVCGDARTYGDRESVELLHRHLARLEAATTVATAALNASGDWRGTGARTASGWLSVCCNLPKSAASRRVRLGRALRHLPVAEQAWLAGDIGAAQVSLLAHARTPVTEDAMARDEALLVGKAKELRYSHFVRAMAYWSQHADPDGAEDIAAKQRDGRRFQYSESFEGMWFGDLAFDPVSGAIFADELERRYDELFAADWAEARARLGDAVTVADLVRTPNQRRADALLEMAVRSGTAPADGRRPEPLFTVLVGYETLAGPVCEMANGTVVTPGTLAQWLHQAWIERVVFESRSRVIDVGVTTRLFTGALRRAIEVRDGECTHDFCDVKASRCQVDHIEPWAAGGRTAEENGRLLCGFHNRRRSRPPDPPPPEP